MPFLSGGVIFWKHWSFFSPDITDSTYAMISQSVTSCTQFLHHITARGILISAAESALLWRSFGKSTLICNVYTCRILDSYDSTWSMPERMIGSPCCRVSRGHFVEMPSGPEVDQLTYLEAVGPAMSTGHGSTDRICAF